jgi:hypothetical protein
VGERLELLLPECFVPREPLARVGERSLGQLAIRDATDFRACDQLRLLEDAQMFRNAWRRDVVWFAKRGDRTRAMRQAFEHRPARRIGERTKHRA